MKRLIPSLLIALLTIVTPVIAQQAGTNVNVLPVAPRLPIDVGSPTTRTGNSRATATCSGRWSRPSPPPPSTPTTCWRSSTTTGRSTCRPATSVSVRERSPRLALKLAQILLPAEIGSYLPKGELVPPMNAAEAWIGGSRSYDGGYTWSGFFLPGARRFRE